MNTIRSRPWMALTAAVVLAATLQRAWNLAYYPLAMGFDAHGNWDYIASLLDHWHLPAPGDGWSTAHPPLFYALAAALGRLLGTTDMETVSRATIAVGGLLALAAAVSVARYVRDRSGGDGPAMAIAAVLVLFLPVHVYTSAMLGEEILTTALASFAMVGLARELDRPHAARSDLLRPAALGVLAGLALLTKMSAVLVVAAGSLVLLGEGPARGWGRALRSTLAFGLAASVVGGWFYLYNLATYGYLYPYGLPVHLVMFEMPPGTRSLIDYVWVPPAAFGPTQASDPSLLHSVWGGLWASAWFDSHRCFVPLHPTRGLDLAARLLLVLGLVPGAAFVAGLVRGARRAVAPGRGSDRLLVVVTALLLAGFVAFTWRNPWFASVKAGYVLALSVPWAVYASETLERWTKGRRLLQAGLAATLGLLAVVTLVTFSYDLQFEKREYPGTEWRTVAP